MKLNAAGLIIVEVWNDLLQRFQGIDLDLSVVMPNHIHGIIIIVGAGLAPPDKGAASGAPTISDIVRVFKSISAIKVNRLLSRTGQHLWQRSYYDHVIRSSDELDRIRHYININPMKWAIDRENPLADNINTTSLNLEENPWQV